MGLIVDSGVLIKAERARISVNDLTLTIRSHFGSQAIEISVVTIAELTHGIYRALDDRQRVRREQFLEDVTSAFVVHDLTTLIAAMAGRIEGQQAAHSICIAFEDLVIGTTALLLDFALLTTNPKHFFLIPNLTVQTF